MNVTVNRKPMLLLEAAELVYAYVNRVSAEQLTGNGAYCIPAGDVQNMMNTACAGLDNSNPLLDFYFRGVTLEEGYARKFYLASCILNLANFTSCSAPRDLVEALSAYWKRGQRPLQVEGIDMRTVHLSQAAQSFVPLSQQVMRLPLPQEFQMKLLDVLLDYEAHLGCVARLLQPVVDALEPLLEPWVQRAMPLADAWEALLVDKQLDALDSVHSNWEPKGYTSIYMALCYFFPEGMAATFFLSDGAAHLYMGVAMSVDMSHMEGEEQKSNELNEQELAALRLLANPARIKMLRLMEESPKNFQEVATALGMNSGVVFRDMNNMVNALLLRKELICGRNYFVTNRSVIRQLTGKLTRCLD